MPDMPRHVGLNTVRTVYGAAAPFAAVSRVARSVSEQSVALLCFHCDYSAALQLCNREYWCKAIRLLDRAGPVNFDSIELTAE